MYVARVLSCRVPATLLRDRNNVVKMTLNPQSYVVFGLRSPGGNGIREGAIY
jgi:hypothetical protein